MHAIVRHAARVMADEPRDCVSEPLTFGSGKLHRDGKAAVKVPHDHPFNPANLVEVGDGALAN